MLHPSRPKFPELCSVVFALSLEAPGGLWIPLASVSMEEKAHGEEDGDAGWVGCYGALEGDREWPSSFDLWMALDMLGASTTDRGELY